MEAIERLEVYDRVNKCESFEELAKVIESLIDEGGMIQGRTRKLDGSGMVHYCRIIDTVKNPNFNYLTREFGIRQQAMYLNYYKISKRFSS